MTSRLAIEMKSGIAMLNPMISATLRSNPSMVAVWYISMGLKTIIELHIQLGIPPLRISANEPPVPRKTPIITEPIIMDQKNRAIPA